MLLIAVELGTPSFEALSGATAAVDYLAALGDRFGGITDGGSLTRRDRLRAGFAAIGAHEHLLKRQFLAGVEDIPGLSIYGGRTRSTRARRPRRGQATRVEPAALVEHLRSAQSLRDARHALLPGALGWPSVLVRT